MSAQANVFLVGPMGAGKTTVGRKLAQARGMDFVDSDQEIERRTGVDISYIFEKEGEAGFRQRESKVIEELTQRERLVLATGGGAVIDPENRRYLAARGFVVYLHADLQQQMRRTRRTAHRPLLQNEDPEGTLERLFEQRDPLYREIADFVVDTRGRAATALAREVDQVLQEAKVP